MSKRLISVLIFAFVVSTVATVVVYRLVATRMTAQATAKEPTVQIVLAARNLPVGTMLGENDLKVGAWAGPLPAGAITKKEDAIGRGVVAAIYEGEPVVQSRLAPKGAGAGLAAVIPPGMRAVAVRVNEVVGVAGFASPGQRVDVLVTGVPPGAPAGTGSVTKTILQNIEVLSAGQNMERDAQGKPVSAQVVNLLVTPEQAEILSLVSNEMRIQLVLRNPLDTQQVETRGVAEATVFTGAPVQVPKPPTLQPRLRAAATPPPAPQPRTTERVVIPITVEVIQGTKKTTSQFSPEPASPTTEEAK